MWPLYLLFNKFLKTEEENALEADEYPKGMVESYSLEQLPSNGKFRNVILPHSHFVEVPHINQQSTWDCGLACVLMVLRNFGINNCNIQALEELCCTTSIWTVDLAYLLQKFSVSFSYFTVTLGANPNFSMETFYKDQLATDLVRVDSLFKKAMEAGIDIQCRSISGDEISLLILSGKYIAIALIDQYKLSQSWLKDIHVSGICGGYSEYTGFVSSCPEEERIHWPTRETGGIFHGSYCPCIPLEGEKSFSSNSVWSTLAPLKGHYVVICGYDVDTDEFEIRDPASSRKHERISSNCLEEARKSFGTDEDLLLISLEKREREDLEKMEDKSSLSV